MKSKKYFIAKKLVTNRQQDFADFVAQLKKTTYMNIIRKSPNSFEISGDMGYNSSLSLLENVPESVHKFAQVFQLEMSPEDAVTLEFVRHFVANNASDYRIFSEYHNYFMPVSTDLVNLDIAKTEYSKRIDKVLMMYGFLPLYFSGTYYAYYAINQQQEIHIINLPLVEYMVEGNVTTKENIVEFSYKVADNIQDFVVYYDNGLIPHDFYEYYNKSQKIINKSFFDINNPGRKIFIKPYIFELLFELGDVYAVAKEGSSLLHMDKILKGETLDKTIIRVLKDELKIATDYEKARVSRQVEFDRDREGKITPRLVISVFVKEFLDKEEVRKRQGKSWNSY